MLVFSSLGSAQLAPKPELVVQTAHLRAVKAVAFSPDGKRSASGSADGTVKIWDVASELEMRTLQAGTLKESKEHGVSSLAFSPDGKLVASGTLERVDLWEVANGHLVQKFPCHVGSVNALAFGPNGQWIAAGGGSGEVTLLQVSSGTELRTLRDHKDSVTSLAISFDGRWLASVGRDDDTVNLWEVPRGRRVHTFKFPPRPILGANPVISFAADGKRLAVATGGGSVERWEIPSGRPLATPSLRDNLILGAAFSSDGVQLASARLDGALVISDVETGRELVTLVAHSNNIFSDDRYALAFSPDGRWLTVGGTNTKVQFWDVKAGSEKHVLTGTPDTINALALSPDKRTLALAGIEGMVFPLSADFCAINSKLKLSTHSWMDYVKALDPCREKKKGGGISTALLDLATGRDKKILTGHTDEVFGAAFSPDGKLFASGGVDGEIKVWEVATGHELHSLSGEGTITALAFSPDGQWLASGRIGEIKIWDLATWRELRTLTPSGSIGSLGKSIQDVEALSFNVVGKYLEAGSWERITFWDVATWQEIASTTGDRQEGWPTIALDPISSLLASGGSDGIVKLWDLENGNNLSKAANSIGGVFKLAFSADTHWLLSYSEDGYVRLWNVRGDTDLETASILSMGSGRDWLVISRDGLFDGTADAMQRVAWRSASGETIASLDSFFTDFYSPGLLADILSDEEPRAKMDVATALQVPGLRAMLAQKFAHIENRDGQVVVCFDQKPGAVINVGPGDQRIFFPAVNGYQPGTAPGCNFEKSLPRYSSNSAASLEQLQSPQLGLVPNPWDGQLSDTAHSVLHVLAVGITEYPADSGFDRLPYAVTSAKAIEEFFYGQKISPKKAFAGVRVWDGLYDKDATREKLRQRFSEMAKEVAEDDVVLLYLAGHGKVSLGEEMFYFVPVDGKDTDVRGTAVSTAMIAEGLRNLPARRIILIVDACQSGGAIEALSKVGVVKVQAEQRRLPQDAGSAIEHGVGVHLIGATLPLSYAVGLKEGESVLAETLLRALRQRGGLITADQLAAFIRENLPTASERLMHGFQQIPLIDSIGLDFPIASQ